MSYCQVMFISLIFFLTAYFMQQGQKIFNIHQKALQRYKTNKKQAIQMLKNQLQSPFDSNYSEDWYNYFTIMIELAGWMRDYQDQTKLQESNAILAGVINRIKMPSIYDKVQPDDLYKIKYSAFQNFAKLLIQQAPSFIKKNDYVKYRNKMNGAYSYFRQAQSLLLQKMGSQINKYGYVRDEQARWYIRTLSNINQFLYIEIDQFNDKACINSILQIADKAEKFHELHKCKKHNKRQIQQHLHRCYYYKAMILYILNKDEQALLLFVKVFNFQKSNRQFQDAEKTSNQITDIFLNQNQISKAFSYNKQKENGYNQIIKTVQARRQKIKKALSIPNNQILAKKRFLFETLTEFNDEQEEYKYKYDFQTINSLIQKILPSFKSNSDQKALLYQYLARVNRYMKNYEKSYNMIQICLTIPTTNKIKQIDCMIEQIQILTMWKHNHPQLPQLIAKVQNQVDFHKINNLDKIQEIRDSSADFQNVIKKLKKIKDKATDKARYQFFNQEQNLLFLKLKEMNEMHTKKVQQTNNKSTFYHEIEQKNKEQNINLNKNNMQAVTIKNIQKNLTLNPQDQYVKRCKQQNIPYRQEIKELLKKSYDFNPFNQIINISAEQIQILIGVIKLQILDLRYHHMNQIIMQKLLNQYNLTMLKQFKINGSGFVQLDTLFKTISKMNQLTYLSFLDFSSQKPSNFHLVQIMNQERMDIQYQTPRSLVHTIYQLGKDTKIQIFDHLIVLKLKYCNLLDGHLPQLNLKNCRNLKEVSLSHNLFEGKQLHHLFNLSQIYAINLSDNPLLSLNIEKWNNRFSQVDFVVRIKLRNIKFDKQLRSDLKYLIYRVQMLDLSESDDLGYLFAQIVQGYWQSGLMLTKLNKLILKNVDLERIDILKFFQFFSRAKEIDFRGCRFSWETKRIIEQKINQQLDLKIKISQKQSQDEKFNKFRLISSSHL